MYNWSVDVKKMKKESPEQYAIWRLEQLINYGLDGEKLDNKEVRRNWSKIKDRLDPYKKRVIEYLLWNRVYSLPNNINFWNWPQRSGK